ncbi:MAG: YeeE/YedE family protein [Beijerinckiaceae bacterium]|nr:YeeE/YedE family protein [Beijerinckiaceae bacterium]
MPLLLALVAGIIFGAGLTVSDMINPARVLNFLDLAGRWDASLLFVMGGALGVVAIGYRLVFRRARPFLAPDFSLPSALRIDAPLLLGAAMFGAGWGLAGICPGPALTALVSFEPKMFAFVAALLVGMFAAKALQRRQQA